MGLIEKDKCFTCGTCVEICPQHAISMKLTNGFFYPVIDDNLCVNCGQCNKVCPALKPGIHNKGKQCLFAFRHSNDDILKQSSSGAAFTALSDIILLRGGVIVGAVMGVDFKVYHIVAHNQEDRNRMRRSKYVQSDVFPIYKNLAKIINDNQWVLFSGTPCQVDAFRNYCITNKLDLDCVVLCALLCHGSSSPVVWEDFILNYQRKYKTGPLEVNFRDKSRGWRNGRFTAIGAGCTYDLNDYSILFHSNVCNRESCFSCPYTTIYREFDITIGDFWTIKDFKPNYSDEGGVSMLLSHSAKGELLIRACEEYGTLQEFCFEPDNNRLGRVLNKPYEKPIEYELFWSDYRKKGINYVVKKYTSMNFSDRVLRWMRKKFLVAGLLRPNK